MELKKIKTGIPGLDDVLKGGLLENQCILFTGAPGTGKSIAALQFLYYGAKNNEPGLIIISEGSIDSFKTNASSLGIDVEEFEKKGLITIIEQSVTAGRIISMDVPINVIKKKNIKRVVLDSLTIFEYVYSDGIKEFKRGIMQFITLMKKLKISFIATAENAVANLDDFEFKEEDFLFDGVVIFIRVRKGATFERCITIPKMRSQEHLLDIYPISIGKGGIKVLVNEIPFSLTEKEAKF